MVLQVALFFVKNSLLDHLLDLLTELTQVKTECKTHGCPQHRMDSGFSSCAENGTAYLG